MLKTLSRWIHNVVAHVHQEAVFKFEISNRHFWYQLMTEGHPRMRQWKHTLLWNLKPQKLIFLNWYPWKKLTLLRYVAYVESLKWIVSENIIFLNSWGLQSLKVVQFFFLTFYMEILFINLYKSFMYTSINKDKLIVGPGCAIYGIGIFEADCVLNVIIVH